MLILNVMRKELRALIGALILHTLKNIKQISFAVLLIKLFVLIINSGSQLFFSEEKIRFIDSLKQFLRSIIIAEE